MIFAIAIVCSLAHLSSARSCPFKGLVQKVDAGVTLETSEVVNKAREIGAAKFCGPPLCNPSSGRRLLANAKMHSNGYPELYSTTITAIAEDFCAILPGGCDTDRKTGEYTGLTNDYTHDFSRGDITAGAVQLAFHDAGEYDPSDTTNPGGPDGCACDKKKENAGLDYIKGLLAPIYEKYDTYLSLGDFWVIAANTALEVSRIKGTTMDFDFKYGRPDHADCDNCLLAVSDRLPNSELSTDHVLEVFEERMGFSKEEIVTLMGAHSLGRAQFNNSGYEFIWDQTMSKLDTRYFIAILSFPWCRYVVDETGGTYEGTEHHEWRVPNEMSEAADFYTNTTPKLLNTDLCMAFDIGDGDDVNEQTCPTVCMEDDIWNGCTNARSEGTTVRMCQESTTSPTSPSGKLTVCNKQANGMRQYVEQYAADSTGELFIPAFAAAFKKLTELGVSDLASPAAVTAPSDLTYATCQESFCKICQDAAYTSSTPTCSGSTPVYSASGLPDGLSIDSATGVISGTPTTVDSASVQYTITASNDAGSTTAAQKMKVLASTKAACKTEESLVEVDEIVPEA